MVDAIPEASVKPKADNILKKVEIDVKSEAAKVKANIETELAKTDDATLAECKALLKDAHDLIERLVGDGHVSLTGFLNRVKAFFGKG